MLKSSALSVGHIQCLLIKTSTLCSALPAVGYLLLEEGWFRVMNDSLCMVRLESLDSLARMVLAGSFFFGARIRLGTILGRFSINYFSGLGLRIRVRVRVRVGVRVSVVIWSR